MTSVIATKASRIQDISFFPGLFYVTQRANLLTSVNEILQKNNLNHLGNQLKLYLYGHVYINYVDNRDILVSTLKYIKETRRFSTYSLSSLDPFGCGWVGVRHTTFFLLSFLFYMYVRFVLNYLFIYFLTYHVIF